MHLERKVGGQQACSPGPAAVSACPCRALDSVSALHAGWLPQPRCIGSSGLHQGLLKRPMTMQFSASCLWSEERSSSTEKKSMRRLSTWAMAFQVIGLSPAVMSAAYDLLFVAG